MAWPRRTREPACTRLPGAASTGTDSPVSIDWSTITEPDVMVASAGTSAPSASLTASPGTSCDACSLTHLPSRPTKAVGASLFLRAVSAALARPSCANPKVALKRSRPPITAASTYSPNPSWRRIAASSIQGMGAQNLARKIRGRDGACSLTVLGPNSARRRRASAAVNPRGTAGARGDGSRISSMASFAMSIGPPHRWKCPHMLHSAGPHRFDARQSEARSGWDLVIAQVLGANDILARCSDA
jgi:hypothetical protein